jgi:hypothetical protein
MRHRKPTHPVVSDMRRELSVTTLAKAGGFRQAMRFPLWGIETARDHIRIFSRHDRKRPPDIIAIDWREMTFGLKPFFVCPVAAQGAVFFITTAYSAIVDVAPIFGIGASASIVGRGCYIDHTSCRTDRRANPRPGIAQPSNHRTAHLGTKGDERDPIWTRF